MEACGVCKTCVAEKRPGPGCFSATPDPGAGQSPLPPFLLTAGLWGAQLLTELLRRVGKRRRGTKACFYGQPFGGLLGHWLPHFLANHDQTVNTVDICLTADAKDYKDMQPFQRSDAKSQLRSILAVKICSEDKTPMHCTGDNAVKKQGQ